MTYREELYNKALKVKEEECLKKQMHYKQAEEYLKDVLEKTALDGKFSRMIIPINFNDGSKLTNEDVEKFAQINELDYIPASESNGFPILSFNMT